MIGAMASSPSTRIPLYRQMYTTLKQQIESGALTPGEQLPPEPQLAERFRVSRGTARQAVTRLVEDGAVVRSAGRGTFVADRRLSYVARGVLGVPEQIRAAGHPPSSEVLEVRDVAAASLEAETAFPPSITRLLSIERVRKADGEAVALEHLLLPLPRFAGVRDVDLAESSIYDSLEEHFAVRLEIGDFLLDIAELTDRQAAHLDEAPRAPVFLMHGTVTDQFGAAIVSVRSFYRPSKYSFQFTMPRDASSRSAATISPRLAP
jgi:GntR family transcriptional regulator